MPDSDEPKVKKPFWRDAGFLIGLGGLVATIVVGVVTYRLGEGSQSREYEQRIKTARGDVLTAVARSLGEGVVPSKAKIQSLLDSIGRQYNIKHEDLETPENVIDDTLARVLANEFLDAKKREELSDKLLTVRAEQLPKLQEKAPVVDTEPKGQVSMRLFFSLIASLLAAGTVTLLGRMFLEVRTPSRVFLIGVQVLAVLIAIVGLGYMIFVRFQSLQIGSPR